MTNTVLFIYKYLLEATYSCTSARRYIFQIENVETSFGEHDIMLLDHRYMIILLVFSDHLKSYLTLFVKEWVNILKREKVTVIGMIKNRVAITEFQLITIRCMTSVYKKYPRK